MCLQFSVNLKVYSTDYSTCMIQVMKLGITQANTFIYEASIPSSYHKTSFIDCGFIAVFFGHYTVCNNNIIQKVEYPFYEVKST